MAKMESALKRRKHDRFRIMGSAIVSLHKPRLIKLGRAKLVELGPIVDISWGGLAVHYIDSKARQIESNELDISTPDEGIRIEGIPFQTVSDIEIADMPDGKKIRRRSIKFGDLSNTQRTGLVNFLQKATRRNDI